MDTVWLNIHEPNREVYWGHDERYAPSVSESFTLSRNLSMDIAGTEYTQKLTLDQVHQLNNLKDCRRLIQNRFNRE